MAQSILSAMIRCAAALFVLGEQVLVGNTLILAAFVIRSVIKRLPLYGGNKGLDIFVGEAFLNNNGYRLNVDDGETVEITLRA